MLVRGKLIRRPPRLLLLLLLLTDAATAADDVRTTIIKLHVNNSERSRQIIH